MPKPLWNFRVTADRLDDGECRVRIDSASGKYSYEKIGNYPVPMLLRMLSDHVADAVDRWELEERCQSTSAMEHIADLVKETNTALAAGKEPTQ